MSADGRKLLVDNACIVIEFSVKKTFRVINVIKGQNAVFRSQIFP